MCTLRSISLFFLPFFLALFHETESNFKYEPRGGADAADPGVGGRAMVGVVLQPRGGGRRLLWRRLWWDRNWHLKEMGITLWMRYMVIPSQWLTKSSSYNLFIFFARSSSVWKSAEQQPENHLNWGFRKSFISWNENKIISLAPSPSSSLVVQFHFHSRFAKKLPEIQFHFRFWQSCAFRDEILSDSWKFKYTHN